MVQAARSNSTPASPPPPPDEIVNSTYDPLGRQVLHGIETMFHPGDIAAFKSVYLTKNAIADEVERLLAILDQLDGDTDLELNVGNLYNDARLDDGEGLQVSTPNGSYFADEDAEIDPADSGIADLDGLAEQLGRVA